MRFKRYIAWLLIALMAVPVAMAGTGPDDDDLDPSIRPGIRRLHPERERAKAIKKLQEQMSRKAEPKADPWDTSDEVWGTVDVVPVAVKDSAAVQGRRVTASAAGQDGKRMVWRDEPVTANLDLLMPLFTVDDGDCLSKYVSRDKGSNEVYFAFALLDSVPGPLRLCVQYASDRPLEYDQLTFTIDGHDYPFFPADPQYGQLPDGKYWESSDDRLRPVYKDLVYALAHGHWVMLKLHGSHGINHVKVLNDGQRDDFANTLALYLLLGGEFEQ